MSRIEAERFLQSDKNTYNFQIVSYNEPIHVISIDGDYLFEFNEITLAVNTTDEFLSEWKGVVNSVKYHSISELLLNCAKAYEKILGIEDVEESPLYTEGQQVFELENDNYDLKFVSRIRISEEDFNTDLLVNVFAFLTAENTARLSRVSKLWYKLTSNETLWKDYCKCIEIPTLTLDTWKIEYIEAVRKSLSISWDPISLAKSVILSNNNMVATWVNQGKVFGMKSNHFTLKLLNVTWMMIGFVNDIDRPSCQIDAYDFSFGYLLFNHSGNTSYGNHGNQWGNKSLPDGFGIDDVVGMCHDIEKGTISYFHNGIFYADVWTGEHTELTPFVTVSGTGSVEIIPTPKEFIPKKNYKSKRLMSTVSKKQ